MESVTRMCDNPNCKNEYKAKTSDLARGWGKCCSKSCAANIREKSKPGYDPKRVQRNNILRHDLTSLAEGLKSVFFKEIQEHERPIKNLDDGDSEYWDTKDFD